VEIDSWILYFVVFLSTIARSCESWTMNKDLVRRINAFEQWCYKRLLKIKWTDKISDEGALIRIKEDELCPYIVFKNRKWLSQVMF